MKTRRSKSARPEVGSRVVLTLGGRQVVATVIEDRGPIGHGGRQLLRVRVEFEDVGEAIEFELPAADVRVAA
ncbi:MAG: hypothetical protein R3B13_25125 [Polyangiaceae bacterium]